MYKYEWQLLPKIAQGKYAQPVRTGEIELDQCPRPGDHIEVGPHDLLEVSKVIHRSGKPILLVC